jgi:nucleotide-binding universal stress UspA family protein
MKIVFPVDGSEYTKRMLAYIAVHGELLGGGHERVFVHVIPELPTVATRQMMKSAIDDYYAVEAESVFEPLRAFALQQHWSVRFEALRGHPAKAIAEFVQREKPALIVMGSHGHGAVGSATLGSVASGVLSRCKVPLLLVR